jgi:hypothetical protein
MTPWGIKSQLPIDLDMKKLILFTVFFTLLAFLKAKTQSFEAVVSTGIGISTYSGWKFRSADDEDVKRFPLVGYQVALTGKYQFSESLGLSLGMQFIKKGEGLEIPGTEITGYKGKTSISYLTIPVMATYSKSFGDILVYGKFGPYFGFGLTAKQISLEPSKNTIKVDFADSGVSRFDLGCSLGVGAGYPLGPGKIIVDLTYDFGFLDVRSNAKEIKELGPYRALCNRTFEIAVGYVLPLGKR